MTANYEDTDIPPINVRIIKDENAGEKRPKEFRTSHRTIVLTATNPWIQIAGYDPARVCIYMNVMDNPIVLSGSVSEASDPASTTGTLLAPNGRLMQIGNDYVIKGNDELFVSAAVYPTRVGYTTLREF